MLFSFFFLFVFFPLFSFRDKPNSKSVPIQQLLCNQSQTDKGTITIGKPKERAKKNKIKSIPQATVHSSLVALAWLAWHSMPNKKIRIQNVTQKSK